MYTCAHRHDGFPPFNANPNFSNTPRVGYVQILGHLKQASYPPFPLPFCASVRFNTWYPNWFPSKSCKTTMLSQSLEDAHFLSMGPLLLLPVSPFSLVSNWTVHFLRCRFHEIVNDTFLLTRHLLLFLFALGHTWDQCSRLSGNSGPLCSPPRNINFQISRSFMAHHFKLVYKVFACLHFNLIRRGYLRIGNGSTFHWTATSCGCVWMGALIKSVCWVRMGFGIILARFPKEPNDLKLFPCSCLLHPPLIETLRSLIKQTLQSSSSSPFYPSMASPRVPKLASLSGTRSGLKYHPPERESLQKASSHFDQARNWNISFRLASHKGPIPVIPKLFLPTFANYWA